MTCPNGSIVLNEQVTEYSTEQAVCTHNGKFLTNGQVLPFSAITCTSTPYHKARYTGNACLSKYKEIEVGFEVENRFIRHMVICFDEKVQTTLYSEFNLTKTIDGYQRGYPRPKFIQGHFYHLGRFSLNKIYTRNNQRNAINDLLGLPTKSYKYISRNGDLFLSRGHLTAKTDFVFGAQHRLTFYYINVAPQWQTFNGRNWNSLEDDLKRFASRRGLDLSVITGTYGVATLPHADTGEDTELYLFENAGRKSIPVPRLYWKIAYEPISKAGTVFIGVNNPYVFDEERDVICTDICDQYDWLTWKPSNITRGYSYCCSIPDFRKVVTTVPSLDVVRLLT